MKGNEYEYNNDNEKNNDTEPGRRELERGQSLLS